MLKKLSDYTGQEHIVSVLRGMVIKENITKKISISGNDELAAQIFNSFIQAINCSQPERGDACGECSSCKHLSSPTVWGDFLLTWRSRIVETTPEQDLADNTVYFSYLPLDGFLSFQIKEGIGTFINPDVLAVFIYAYQGTKEDVLKASRKLAKNLTFSEYSQQFMDVLINVLYLKNNLEIREVQKIDALRALSVRISKFDVMACIRVLWESQNTSSLLDHTRIEIVSLLISETLQPTPVSEPWVITTEDSQKPINVIEEHNLEQPMDLEKMLEVAYA